MAGTDYFSLGSDTETAVSEAAPGGIWPAQFPINNILLTIKQNKTKKWVVKNMRPAFDKTNTY